MAPTPADLDVARALAAHRDGRLDDAERGYRAALAHDPGHAEAVHFLGVIAHQRGHHDEAAAQIQAAIARDPAVASFHQNLAQALVALDRPEAAEAAFRAALRLSPAYGLAHLGLGQLLSRQGRFEAAIEHLGQAAALDPGSWAARHDLGVTRVYAHCGRVAAGAAGGSGLDDGIAALDEAVRLAPDAVETQVVRASALLLAGRFAEGWAAYEWRRRLIAHAGAFEALAPPWRGEPVNGATVLLWNEQGAGDMIQFARFVPAAAALGARVVLCCPPPLAGLLGRLPGVAAVVAGPEGRSGIDRQCPLGSLPALLDAQPVPYLAPDPGRAAAWRRRLGASGRPRVGLVWAGNPEHANDRRRSLPPAAIRPLIDLPGIDFVSLQVGAPAALPPGVLDLAPDLADFDDTAAVVAALDLVIAADTSVAHLVGALGRPVWILIPMVPDWRWGLGRSDSPWYPTARLFRQGADAAWPPVVAAVAAALRDGVPA